MCEKNKLKETEVEEEKIDPIDKYLDNYKEQKLAEFCVQKDEEIASRKEERQKMVDQISDLKLKAEKYEKTWKNVGSLYSEIKKLPVNEYLRLYHLFLDDITNHEQSYSTTAYRISKTYVDGNQCSSGMTMTR